MRHLYSIVFFLLIQMVGKSQASFCGTANSTFYSSNVLFSNTLNPMLDGNVLPYGSHIIAVFNHSGNWECAGFVQWNGNSVTMVINGSDGNLPGYSPNEAYKFIVQLPDGCLLDSVNVDYDVSGVFDNAGAFQDGGLSKIAALSAFSKPWVSLHATDGYCGENTAQITATATNFGAPYTYEWSSGSSNAQIEDLPTGNYSLTVTDYYGCSQTSAAIVSNTPAMSLQLQTEPGQNSNECESTVIVEGGTAPFTYIWSNGQTTPQATGLTEGNFSVTLTDVNGCQAVQNGTCMSVGTIELENIEDLRIYPNPSGSYLQAYIHLTEPKQVKIWLLDMSGHQLFETMQYGSRIYQLLDLEPFSNGHYIFQVSDGNSSKSLPVTILK